MKKQKNFDDMSEQELLAVMCGFPDEAAAAADGSDLPGTAAQPRPGGVRSLSGSAVRASPPRRIKSYYELANPEPEERSR
jgi:hypothetical protein